MPPIRPPMPVPPGAGAGMPPVRPPGMKAGGVIKKAKGGFLAMKEKVPGKTYKGFPHSPTTKEDDAVSAHASGGSVGAVRKRADGGGITLTKKLQLGGGAGGLGMGMGAPGPMGASATPPGGTGFGGLFPGRGPIGGQQGPANISGRPMIPPQPAQTAQMPRMATSVLARPAPGTTPTFSKRGGSIPHNASHSDEAQDKKLIAKMIKKEEKAEKKASGGLVGSSYHDWGVGKRAKGGVVNPGRNQTARGLASSTYHQQGKGLASGGLVLSNATGGGGGGKARLAKARAFKSVPAKTEA